MAPGMMDYHYEVKTTNAARDLHRSFDIFDAIVEDLESIQAHTPIGVVTIEDYGPINKFSGKIAQRAETVGMLKRHIIRELLVPVVTILPKSIKKYATGNGNSKKSVMIQSAAQLYHFYTDSDNEADACCLAHFGYAVLCEHKTKTPFEYYKPD